MISRTLPQTKKATFAVLLPDPSRHDFQTPVGTGFFVSPDGLFITAAHVIKGPFGFTNPEESAQRLILEKEPQFPEFITPGAHGAALVAFHEAFDFALLKFDLAKNAHREWLAGAEAFPHITVSTEELQEGDAVYSFGYPLPESFVQALPSEGQPAVILGGAFLAPRATSAIVSSKFERARPVYTSSDPKVYVLDKALNYGNSGGPILAQESGNVHALCSRFQPVFVPQTHLKNPITVVMPSLYGIVTSLSNDAIRKALLESGAPLHNKDRAAEQLAEADRASCGVAMSSEG